MVDDELGGDFPASYTLAMYANSNRNFAQSFQAVVSRYKIDVGHGGLLSDVHDPRYDVFFKHVVLIVLPVNRVVL